MVWGGTGGSYNSTGMGIAKLNSKLSLIGYVFTTFPTLVSGVVAISKRYEAKCVTTINNIYLFFTFFLSS